MNERKNKILTCLAPMAGYTDSIFRRICANFGADMAVSEMISAVALTKNDKKTARLAKIGKGEAPTFLQIFGHEPSVMREAAKILLDGAYDGCDYASAPAGIDINMGCPVKKIVTSGDGSALMRDMDTAAAITSAVSDVCEAHGVPLSVKFRAGWDENSINAPVFAEKMAAEGAKILTVHCRTREQMYAPSANPSIAAEVAERLRGRDVLLFGNGDVDSVASAANYISLGCGGVAIGRAALGNPWLFREIKKTDFSTSADGVTPPITPPTIDEIRSLIVSFVTEVVEFYGEEVGIRESRGRAAHFLRGIRGSAKIRDSLNHAKTLEEFIKILDTIE